MVLAAVLSRVPAVSLAGGWVQDWTGLTDADVAAALRELEDAGVLAPGSVAAGRADVLTPAVLDVLGVPEFLSLGWDVLPDVPPTGGGVGATFDDEHDEGAEDEDEEDAA